MLEKSPKDLTDLANELDLPSMETKKQLDNMMMLGLVDFDVGEEYRITSVGWTTLELLKALEHVAERSDYYNGHDLRWLPQGLLRQIDHLDGTELLTTSEQGGDVIRKRQGLVNRFCWIQAEVVPPFLVPIFANMLDRGVNINIVSSIDSVRDVRARLVGHDVHRVEYRTVRKATVFIIVTDDFALLGLPRQFGGIDVDVPIMGDSAPFRSWCESLFHVLWNQGVPVTAPVRI
jgi:predicted transcriptional regulator